MNHSKQMATGLAMGAAAIAAMGAGAYMAYNNPKQMKKMKKKAAHNTETALGAVDKMMSHYF